MNILFDHKMFNKYEFEDVPLNQDIFIVDEVYLKEYEEMMLKFFEGAEHKNIGYVSHVGARKINNNFIELSWYPNIFDRFHEVSINLPRNQFVACVGSWRCEERLRIFVKSAWLENIHLRSYSVFALIDAIGVTAALKNEIITREKLIKLRSEIDSISEKYPEISFISFADSILLKSNWSVGHFKSTTKYNYEPEIFIHLANDINVIYQRALGLNTYTIITQGGNEYYDDPLLHIFKNHISLNSLGIPFAQLMEIDRTVREAIKTGVHPPAELYMDEQYFRSLKFKYSFDKNAQSINTYKTKLMSISCRYYYSTIKNICTNLKRGTAG